MTSIANLLGLIGVDLTPPTTLGEFFPWFFVVLLGFCLIAGFLQLVRWVMGFLTKGAGHLC